MDGIVNEQVSVIMSYDALAPLTMPRKMRWRGREYYFHKLTYHHKLRQGRNVQHVFHVTDGVTDFRLRLDSDNLTWTLEEIYDESGRQYN